MRTNNILNSHVTGEELNGATAVEDISALTIMSSTPPVDAIDV